MGDLFWGVGVWEFFCVIGLDGAGLEDYGGTHFTTSWGVVSFVFRFPLSASTLFHLTWRLRVLRIQTDSFFLLDCCHKYYSILLDEGY